jgi:endonuclease YncB( thermonuclease family)
MRGVALSPIRFVIAATALLAILAGAAAEPIDSSRIYVIDGDTIAVDEVGPHFRLVGFNAPDKGDRAACPAEAALTGRATELLRQIVAAGHLDLERVPCSCRPGTEGTDRCNFGRYCGELKSNGVNVGLMLIRDGLAAPFVCGVTSCPKLPHPWCGDGG